MKLLLSASLLMLSGYAVVRWYLKEREQFIPMSKVNARWEKLPKVECGVRKRF
jgi:hypothetical protein